MSDLNELKEKAKSLGINTRNYKEDKLMQLITEAEVAVPQQQVEFVDFRGPLPSPVAPIIQAVALPTNHNRVQEIMVYLQPQIDQGLKVEFDDVSMTFSQHGKTICTNLSTPNHVIQRQIHAFLSPVVPTSRASGF